LGQYVLGTIFSFQPTLEAKSIPLQRLQSSEQFFQIATEPGRRDMSGYQGSNVAQQPAREFEPISQRLYPRLGPHPQHFLLGLP